MTQEEKDLLFKDLSARLPYGVRCLVDGKNLLLTELNMVQVGTFMYHMACAIKIGKSIEDIKPYLRPLSSMTREEIKATDKMTMMQIFDYYNSIYVDYRGLISKGLALEAPEDMYKFI